ncbi:MAG: sugar phosphate isomerase/epimerase [Anaerolineae bacterium]|nr:sugar phosphate isomerase/epimerase [Anaerolineae bacterium]
MAELLMPVGEVAMRRLCAPLPMMRGWRAAVKRIAALGIGTVELGPEWLLESNQIRAADLSDALEDAGIEARIARLPAPPLHPGDPGRLPLWDLVSRADHFLLPSGQLGQMAPSISLMAEMAEVYHTAGATLLLENDPEAWPPDGQTLGRFVAEVGHPGLLSCYDPARSAALKRHPFLTDFLSGPLKQGMRCLRLRDALFENGREVRPGEGNAELKELVSALESRRYQGWYILSPFGRGPYPDRLQAAYDAVRGILASL